MLFDHVEIFVPDRPLAEQWYADVLGFHAVSEFADWAEQGPLMIANTAGQMIALFVGTAQGSDPIRGIRRLAFRAGAAEFADFVTTSSRWSSPPLGVADIQDHEKSISVYFRDPFGNPLEVTTYEHDAARRFVESLRLA